MAVDQFGNPLTEEERYRLMLQQQQLGLLPGPVDTFANIPATPPSINYSQVMEDWSDPAILSEPAFDVPRPATTADVTPCLLYTSPSPRDQRGSRMPSWG